MASKKVIGRDGTIEIVEYTLSAEEIEHGELTRVIAAEMKAARLAAKEERKAGLEDLKPSDNSVPKLRDKINYLLEAVRELQGLN